MKKVIPVDVERFARMLKLAEDLRAEFAAATAEEVEDRSTPRVYETWKVSWQATGSGGQVVTSTAEGVEARGHLVPPGGECTYSFGEVFCVPSQAVANLPEAEAEYFGVSGVFDFRELVVDDSIAEYFDVEAVFVGNLLAWKYGKAIPAAKFVEAADSRPQFSGTVIPGACVAVRVRNKSDESRAFLAKVSGRQRPVPADYWVAAEGRR